MFEPKAASCVCALCSVARLAATDSLPPRSPQPLPDTRRASSRSVQRTASAHRLARAVEISKKLEATNEPETRGIPKLEKIDSRESVCTT